MLTDVEFTKLMGGLIVVVLNGILGYGMAYGLIKWRGTDDKYIVIFFAVVDIIATPLILRHTGLI